MLFYLICMHVSVYYIVYLFLNLNLLSFHIITSIDHFLWIMMATNTTKDLIIGRIYEIRQSIRNAFNLESNKQTANYSSTNSSVTTASSESASSARKKKLRPFTRSCLLWGQNQDHCIVLLITTFNDTDPVNNNQVAESFGMKKDELLKRLIPIHKTKPITGQFSIQFQQMPSIHDKLDPNPRSIETASFTVRKRIVNVVKTEFLRPDTV